MATVVADAIRASGKTQREIATEAGIPLVTLSRKLTGNSPFNAVDLASIAITLRLSIVEFAVRADKLAERSAA